MQFIILLVIGFIFVPSAAFAWGPLTHIYLGSEVFFLSASLPPAVYGLIRRYKQDFLYGNLMADMVLGKKYLPGKKNSHNWDVALAIGESAKTQAEEAFSLGYMSHLAADTVAHGRYTAGSKNLRHAFLELRADSLIDRAYWFQAVSIDGKVQARNDAFLEGSLERLIFSFKTNKRIFKTAVALSGLNASGLNSDFSFSAETRSRLEGFHEESLDRIIDVLKNGNRSEVLKKDPRGGHRGHGPLSLERALSSYKPPSSRSSK